MKILIALAFLFLQLPAAFAGLTKSAAVVKSHTETKENSSSQLSSSPLHKSLYAENVQPQHYTFSYRKIRDQRFWFNTISTQDVDCIFFAGKFSTAIIPQAPASIPLSRLLLFPKHYFW